MLFSSITFLFMFLPATLLLYYISPVKIKNIVLLICSLLFYAWGEPRYVLVMLVMVCVGYGMGRLTDIQRKKQNKTGARVVLVCTIIIDIGVLFFFKYMGFFASSVRTLSGINLKLTEFSLPLGISFYTFQLLSYNIDVYRGTIEVQKNIRKLFTYITLFPQLVAGPIVRYDVVCSQLDRRTVDMESFGEGSKRFIIGLAKKVLLANMAGEIHEMISKTADAQNTILLMWICSFAFTVQIYFDFSGYSDMAIGLGRMFGFTFPENFDYPYISKSITEFWRRWHITLSSWFRDYIYIPLGGNRGSVLKTLRNLFVVWLLTGLWHGAAWNFVLWGLYYFVLLVLEKFILGTCLNKVPKIISHIYTLFFVNLGWVLFSYESLSELKHVLLSMFGGGGLIFCNDYTFYIIRSYACFFGIALIASTPLMKKLFSNAGETTGKSKSKVRDFIVAAWMFFLLVVSTAALASASFNPFLYFRF